MRVTVIATGFEERKEKAELPNIKKWTPVTEPATYKGADRLLAKSLGGRSETKTAAPDMFNYEEAVDIPTFLRRPAQKEL